MEEKRDTVKIEIPVENIEIDPEIKIDETMLRKMMVIRKKYAGKLPKFGLPRFKTKRVKKVV